MFVVCSIVVCSFAVCCLLVDCSCLLRVCFPLFFGVCVVRWRVMFVGCCSLLCMVVYCCCWMWFVASGRWLFVVFCLLYGVRC